MKKGGMLVLMPAVCMLLGSPPSSGSTSPLADRSEAVILKGRSLPAVMLGGLVGSYRVFADHGQGPAAIPMQIDECDANGAVLVGKGPKPDKLDGKFDPMDELVFMARDAGGPLKSTTVAGCEKTAVLTITDPKSGAAAYVLVGRCSHPPALSSQDYVRLAANPYTAITDRYRFCYRFGWHQALKFFYDYISINNGPDILDRLRIRAVIGKFGINYTFQEDQFHYTLLGYNDGPVRVCWKADNYWSLGPLGKLDVPQTIFFYADYCLLKNKIDISMNPALIGLDMSLEIGHDMTIPPDRGASACTNALPQCQPLNHKIPDGAMKKYTDQAAVWGGTSAPEGALMIRVVVDPRLSIPVQGKFTYDQDFSDPPEYVKGMMPRISFFPGLEKSQGRKI